MVSNEKVVRAPLSTDLSEFRGTLARLLPLLEQKADWYCSVFFERRASKSYSVSFKQSNVADQATRGVVLRIYDGFTLHEQATDDLAPEALEKLAREFAARVAAQRPAPGLTARPYRAPTWAERLSVGLDPEIRGQIVGTPAPSTPVHFGIRFQQDPVSVTAEQHLSRLKGWVARMKQLAPACGIPEAELTYGVARLGLGIEESIFIDRESNLSQTLYRLSQVLVTMSGGDRTFSRVGGLGGMEALSFSDAELRAQLEDLREIRRAVRLEPGKHRVIFGPELSGVLAHEAFGHAQEGDTCARGRSKAWELHHSAEKVGNEHATILNNPAIFQNGVQPVAAWGSYFFDEEGWLSLEQVLLDQGTLRAPMTNLTSAIRLGVPRSANGKRETWASGVYTRQTNTYFSAGGETLEGLLQKMGDGYLGLAPAGGMEDPKGMGIQVGISYLKEVKGGKLTGRVFKGPAGGDIQLTGFVPDVLRSIVAKSKIEADSAAPDRARHPYNDVGGCGKYHKEFVVAGCGGPYLLLDQVTLG